MVGNDRWNAGTCVIRENGPIRWRLQANAVFSIRRALFPVRWAVLMDLGGGKYWMKYSIPIESTSHIIDEKKIYVYEPIVLRI